MFFSFPDTKVRSLQKLATKWKVRYFRQKKKLQAMETKHMELLRSIQQGGAKFPDLRARRPDEPLRQYDEDEEDEHSRSTFKVPGRTGSYKNVTSFPILEPCGGRWKKYRYDLAFTTLSWLL